MAWDDKGWHQYNHGFSVIEGDIRKHVCKDCGFTKSDHLPLVEYVALRLQGRKK